MVESNLQEQSDQGHTVCHSVCILWIHYSMVVPHSSNFRVFTTNVLGVRIFRKFTVVKKPTIIFLSFQTDRSGQTVQTQIRLLLEEQSDQGLHCLQFPLHLLDALL